MADLIFTEVLKGLPAGVYTGNTTVTNGLGAVVGTFANTRLFNPPSITQQTANWRRKFRRYVHWLERQNFNFANNLGIFAAPGPSPALSLAESTVLVGVAGVLAGLGYVVPTISTGAAPITPP
jgi:hypothetical protein